LASRQPGSQRPANRKVKIPQTGIPNEGCFLRWLPMAH
jgi:hypothetical protein